MLIDDSVKIWQALVCTECWLSKSGPVWYVATEVPHLCMHVVSCLQIHMLWGLVLHSQQPAFTVRTRYTKPMNKAFNHLSAVWSTSNYANKEYAY